MLDKKIADKLSLPRTKGTVLNFDKNVTVEWTDLPQVRVGPLRAHDAHVMVGDLKQFSEFADGVDAIVGLDLLRTSQSLGIDYRKGVVIFRSSSGGGPVEPQVAALTVQLPVQGQTLRLIIDTGIKGLLLYQDRLRSHLPHLKLAARFPKLLSVGSRVRQPYSPESGLVLTNCNRRSCSSVGHQTLFRLTSMAT